MSGMWQNVCTRPKEKSQNPAAEMFFCSWNFTLCLKTQSLCWFKLRAGAHQNFESLRCFLLWDPRLVFYLVFSLFLDKLCPVCCTGRGCWCCVLCRWDALCPAAFPGILLPNFCVFAGWAPSLLSACLWHLGRAGRINIPVFPSHIPWGGTSMWLLFSCRNLMWALRGCRTLCRRSFWSLTFL